MKLETKINKILNSDYSPKLKALKLYGIAFNLVPGSEQQKQLITELGKNQISVYFFSEYAQITTGCIRTIKVPQKCLKSLEMLSEWVINKGVKLWNY